MTTFKGFVRSTNATMNRMAREAARIEKLHIREEMLTNAAEAVKRYNELIAVLTSIHVESAEPMDWRQVQAEPAPLPPVVSDQHERLAKSKQSNYSPGFFDRLIGSTNRKKAKLEQNVITARKRDTDIFEYAQQEYAQEHREWEELQQISGRILRNDLTAYRDAVKLFNRFSEIDALGSTLNFTFHADHIVGDLLVRADNILPRQVYSLTSTGKLSKKDMAISKFNELYQDHVCSSILRVGREILALLPVRFAIINAMSDLVNPATGKIEQQTIVSAAIFPETLARLNFDAIDPSESMKNFKHLMDFSKTAGFRVVGRLKGEGF